MSNDLLKAILAMDSYNRSYNEGIIVTGTSLGGATILQRQIGGVNANFDSQALGILPKDNPSDPDVRRDIDVGFYAIAHEYNEEVIISYRGTDGLERLENLKNGMVNQSGYAYDPI